MKNNSIQSEKRSLQSLLILLLPFINNFQALSSSYYINSNNPTGLEEALLKYHDRVVAEGGVVHVGVDNKIKEPSKYYQYVAFSIATGHLYHKSLRSQENYVVDTTLARILNLKKEHAAFEQLGKRQKLNTNDDRQFYAFIQKANSNAERILCVFNFQATEQQVTIDMSGVDAKFFLDLDNSQTLKYIKQFQIKLPAFGYRFHKIIQ